MPQLNGQFLGTVGMELESVGLSGRIVNNYLSTKLINKYGREGVITITRDASTESFAENINTGGLRGLPIYKHTRSLDKFINIGRNEQYPIGYELIVNPIEIKPLEELLFIITNSLQMAGDFETERASTHYHVGFGNNLRILKNLLRICLYIDPFLYRLGGMGRKFRGFSNEAAYARPLLHSSAVLLREFDGRNNSPSNSSESLSDSMERTRRNMNAWLRSEISTTEGTADFLFQDTESVEEERPSGNYVKIINPEAALNATNIEQFWSSFGVNVGSSLPKYHPCRYTGCNFYAVASHGTFEFRHFNQSLDYALLYSIAKMLRATVELSTIIGKNDISEFYIQDSSVEISMEDSVNTVEKLMRMFIKYEIEDIPSNEDINIILKTTENSSFTKISKVPVKTHVNDFSISRNRAELGNLEVVNEVKNPNQVDIHTIRNYPLTEEI